MDSTIPKPEPGLSVKLETLPAGSALKRVHEDLWGPKQFNPGYGHARFSPLSDIPGEIPTIYAADSIENALMETAFHDVAHSPGLKFYDANRLDSLILSTLRTTTAIQIAKCYGPALRALGITEGDLVHSPASQYAETREWAKAIYAQPVKADGMVWKSRQGDGKAYMIFGDRKDDSFFVVVDSKPLMNSPEAVDAVNRLAADMDLLLHRDP